LVGRIGLHMWQFTSQWADKLGDQVGFPQMCRPGPPAPPGCIDCIPLPPVCLPPMEDVVKVFLTFDSPHTKGAYVPPALQAYLRDPKLAEFVPLVQGIIERPATKQLLMEYVARVYEGFDPEDFEFEFGGIVADWPDQEGGTYCFDPGGCALYRDGSTPNSTMDPGPFRPYVFDNGENQAFYARIDGLYPDVPSFAVANGSVQRNPFPSDSLMHVDVSANLCIGPLCPDNDELADHLLFDDAVQRTGSTLDLVEFVHGLEAGVSAVA
jgi:hypothetical protein